MHVLLLFFDCRENAPGQQECDQAADMINKAINKIDQASLSAISNSLKPTTEGSLTVNYFNSYLVSLFFIYFRYRGITYFFHYQGLEEKMMLTCTQLQESVPNTVEYAKSSPEHIGHAVSAGLNNSLFKNLFLSFNIKQKKYACFLFFN